MKKQTVPLKFQWVEICICGISSKKLTKSKSYKNQVFGAKYWYFQNVGNLNFWNHQNTIMYSAGVKGVIFLLLLYSIGLQGDICSFFQ